MLQNPDGMHFGVDFMQERIVEKELKTQVESLGGLCLKFTSPGTKGVPDRIVIWPGGRIHFIEVKDEGGYLSPTQKVILKKLSDLGCTCMTLVGLDDVKKYLEDYREKKARHEI